MTGGPNLPDATLELVKRLIVEHPFWDYEKTAQAANVTLLAAGERGVSAITGARIHGTLR